MNDLQRLKTQTDLRELVAADLGQSSMRGGEARLWKCPFHRERRGYSLVVWEDGWRCFGACQESGDVFDWLRKYRGLTIPDASDYLGGVNLPPRVHVSSPVERLTTYDTSPPDEDWQEAVKRIVAHAEHVLWSERGSRALDYLHRRGLKDKTIHKAHLGLIPGRSWEWLRVGQLRVPCGIAIPWLVGQELWALKVRRAAGLPKYTQIAGGSAHGLYNAAALEGHQTVLFVEGEFDALLAEQECGGLVGVATLGSASASLNPHWLTLLVHCKSLLVAYDADEAGKKGAARLQALTKRARVVQVPAGKDMTEFVLQGGSVQQWLNDAL